MIIFCFTVHDRLADGAFIRKMHNADDDSADYILYIHAPLNSSRRSKHQQQPKRGCYEGSSGEFAPFAYGLSQSRFSKLLYCKEVGKAYVEKVNNNTF